MGFQSAMQVEHVPGGQPGCAQRLVLPDGQCLLCRAGLAQRKPEELEGYPLNPTFFSCEQSQ